MENTVRKGGYRRLVRAAQRLLLLLTGVYLAAFLVVFDLRSTAQNIDREEAIGPRPRAFVCAPRNFYSANEPVFVVFRPLCVAWLAIDGV